MWGGEALRSYRVSVMRTMSCGLRGGPCAVVADEGVGEDEELSHDGGEGELEGLSLGAEPVVGGLEVGIASDGGESGHVDGAAQGGAPAADPGLSLPAPGLAGDRRSAGEAAGLARVEGADLGHLGEDGGGGDPAEPGDADEDGGLSGEVGLGGDERGHGGVDLGDGALGGAGGAGGLAAQERQLGGAGTVLGGELIGLHGDAGAVELVELGLDLGRRGLGFGREQRAHAGEHGGVDAVGLGEDAGRLGEAAGAGRVEAGEGEACPLHRPLERAVVAAGRLEDDAADVGSDPGEQRAVAPGVVGEAPGLCAWPAAGVEVRFRDVDADGRVAHLFRCPMLVMRALRSGFRSGLGKDGGRSNTIPALRACSTTIRPAAAAGGGHPQRRRQHRRKPIAMNRLAEATPKLLSGGNPQIPKGEGDGPVQAYLAAMPGWKRDIGRRLDAVIADRSRRAQGGEVEHALLRRGR